MKEDSVDNNKEDSVENRGVIKVLYFFFFGRFEVIPGRLIKVDG